VTFATEERQYPACRSSRQHEAGHGYLLTTAWCDLDPDRGSQAVTATLLAGTRGRAASRRAQYGALPAAGPADTHDHRRLPVVARGPGPPPRPRLPAVSRATPIRCHDLPRQPRTSGRVPRIGLRGGVGLDPALVAWKSHQSFGSITHQEKTMATNSVPLDALLSYVSNSDQDT
jgi:hypothetical protein